MGTPARAGQQRYFLARCRSRLELENLGMDEHAHTARHGAAPPSKRVPLPPSREQALHPARTCHMDRAGACYFSEVRNKKLLKSTRKSFSLFPVLPPFPHQGLSPCWIFFLFLSLIRTLSFCSDKQHGLAWLQR